MSCSDTGDRTSFIHIGRGGRTANKAEVVGKRCSTPPRAESAHSSDSAQPWSHVRCRLTAACSVPDQLSRWRHSLYSPETCSQTMPGETVALGLQLGVSLTVMLKDVRRNEEPGGHLDAPATVSSRVDFANRRTNAVVVTKVGNAVPFSDRHQREIMVKVVTTRGGENRRRLRSASPAEISVRTVTPDLSANRRNGTDTSLVRRVYKPDVSGGRIIPRTLWRCRNVVHDTTRRWWEGTLKLVAGRPMNLFTTRYIEHKQNDMTRGRCHL